MPENTTDLEVEYQKKRTGQDIFGFYKHEISDLLTQDVDENFWASSSRANESGNVYSKAQDNGERTCSPLRASSLFGNSLENAVPCAKRELLMSSLQQCVRALAHEVDEMVYPVVHAHHIMPLLKLKKQHLEGESPLGSSGLSPLKKQRTSSNADKKLTADQSGATDNEAEEIVSWVLFQDDEDLKKLLEKLEIKDTLKLEKLIIEETDCLDVTLKKMQEDLEQLLDVVVSKCRAMTEPEKQQLCKLIQKLPPKNLDRIVEIIRANHGKSSETLSSDEITAELEEQENVTLWRLYFYVKAVENASNVSA